MTISYFERRGTGFMPGENSAGPWAPDMLHGRFVGALATRALEQEFVEDGWRISRLTVDMFRAVQLELVEITTTAIRVGRRIRVADAAVTVGGVAAGSVRAVVLVQGTPPPGTIWTAEPWTSPHPETLPIRDKPDDKQSSAWEFRIHEGGFGSDDRARVWTRETGRLVADEPLSPAVRAALSADLASPLANGSAAGVGYINADYTLAMARYPTSDWVGIEASTHLAADGIALGAATMYDLDGPFATSTTTALANPILD